MEFPQVLTSSYNYTRLGMEVIRGRLLVSFNSDHEFYHSLLASMFNGRKNYRPRSLVPLLLYYS